MEEKHRKKGQYVKKQENENFESLEELVKKCGSKGYKKKNEDKCKVIETIDLVLVGNIDGFKHENEIIVSDVNFVEGNLQNDLEDSKLDEINEKKEIEQEGLNYENPSIQKEDIVNSIKTKTDEEKSKEDTDKNEVIENEIKTYGKSDIITSEKVKKKKAKRTLTKM